MLFGSLPEVRAFTNKYETGKKKTQEEKKRGMAGRTPTLSGSVLTFQGTTAGEEGENDLIEGSEERTKH